MSLSRSQADRGAIISDVAERKCFVKPSIGDKYSGTEMTHLTSIHNSLARTSPMAPPNHKVFRNAILTCVQKWRESEGFIEQHHGHNRARQSAHCESTQHCNRASWRDP